MSGLTYSVAVCTRNRADLLARTLAALDAQLPADVELLVVDNASTDRTAQVAQSNKRVHYYCEPTLGIAFNRNRAAREAKGDWLIYVDDDALPVADWFTQMRHAIETQKAQCVIGKVALDWQGGRARWFPEGCETLLSRYDLGEAGCWVGPGGYLLTTNAAFDRRLLLELGAFRTDLGHRGQSLLGGEDNDIFNRLTEQGSRIWYEPAAQVDHWVPAARQTRSWLIKRVFWDGATQPLLDYGTGQPRPRYLREIARDLRRILRITWERRRAILSGTGRLELVLEWTRQIGRLWMNAKLAVRPTS